MRCASAIKLPRADSPVAFWVLLSSLCDHLAGKWFRGFLALFNEFEYLCIGFDSRTFVSPSGNDLNRFSHSVKAVAVNFQIDIRISSTLRPSLGYQNFRAFIVYY